MPMSADHGDDELEVTVVLKSDMSAGGCVIQIPADSAIRFEAIGKDADGGFLRTDTGLIKRLSIEDEDLEHLLSMEHVLIQELDHTGEFGDLYSVNPISLDHKVGL